MPLGYYHPAYGATPAGVGQNFASMTNRGRGSSDTTTPTTTKSLAQRVAEIVGFKATTRDGTSYEVAKAGSDVVIRVKPPGAAVAIAVRSSSANWARVATAVLNLKRAGGTVFQKATTATGPGGKRSSRTTTPTTTPDTSSTPDTGSGAQAPSWASALYLAEITALVGKTIPSNFYTGMTFTIKTAPLDGVDAPVITVTPASGAATDIAPNAAQWTDTASQVLSASAAAAAGGSSSGGGLSSGGGTVTVVTDEATPAAADQALVDAAVETVDTAVTDAMTVSGETAKATGEEGFFSKYKWWLLGGAALVAYTQREAIMKMVK